jgi:hypothetical protein
MTLCSEHYVMAQFNLSSDLVCNEFCQIRNSDNLSSPVFTWYHLSFLCRKFNLPRLTVFVDLEEKQTCTCLHSSGNWPHMQHTTNSEVVLISYWENSLCSKQPNIVFCYQVN